MEIPAPVSIARHVADLLAVLDAAAVARPSSSATASAALLALEFAARHPERAAAVVAYEPPYLAVASAALLARFGQLPMPSPSRTPPAARRGGSAVRPRGRRRPGWEPRTRPAASLEAEGSGALADTSMNDLDLAGCRASPAPVVLATGGGSDDF